MTGQGKETEDPPWRAVGRGDRAEGTGDPPWRVQISGDRGPSMESTGQRDRGSSMKGARQGRGPSMKARKGRQGTGGQSRKEGTWDPPLRADE